MKNWNKTRWFIFAVGVIANIIIVSIKIKTVNFIDTLAIFGIEAVLLSWSFILNYRSDSTHFEKKDSGIGDILKQSLIFIFRIEIILLISFFLLYSYKSYFAFQSGRSFFILAVMIFLNNFIIITYHQTIIAWSKSKFKTKVLIKVNSVITFVVIMTNLPLINYNKIFEEILYFSPFPGFFLAWINPNLEPSFSLGVPYLSILLPFIFLYKELKQGNN